MKKELAQFLINCSENSGNEARLEENYSGRGMYGKETCGVVVDSVPQLLCDVLNYFKENISQEIGHCEYMGAAIPDITSFRIDSMGRGTILY